MANDSLKKNVVAHILLRCPTVFIDRIEGPVFDSRHLFFRRTMRNQLQAVARRNVPGCRLTSLCVLAGLPYEFLCAGWFADRVASRSNRVQPAGACSAPYTSALLNQALKKQWLGWLG